MAASRDARLHRPRAGDHRDGRRLRQPVRPVRRPRQELRHAGAHGQRRLRLRDGRLHDLPRQRRQPEAVVPPSSGIRFDDGARGPCQRRVRQGDRPRGAGVDKREDDAGVRLHRTHQRRQVRRPGRRHRGLLHLHAPRGRTQRHGRGQRVMSEHPCRRAVHRRPGRARPPVHRARQDRTPAADAGQDAAQQAVAAVQGPARRACRAQRAGAEHRQPPEGPHRPGDSAAVGGRPVRRPVHGGQRGAHRAGLP